MAEQDEDGPLVPVSYTVENPDALPGDELKISIVMSRPFNGYEPGRMSPVLPKGVEAKKFARERVMWKLTTLMNRTYDKDSLTDLTDWPKKKG